MTAAISDSEIVALYQSGKSLRDIAKILGRSIRRPSNVIRKAGIARPWQGSGPKHSQWKGGRLSAGEGYFRVWIPSSDPMAAMRNHHGYVREHRLVLARKLGRPLLATETVHHIDGERSNNGPENLQLRQGKHGKHVVMCCLDCGSRNVGHARLGEH